MAAAGEAPPAGVEAVTLGTERALLTAGLLGGVALFVASALRLSPVARLGPMTVGVPLLVLLGVELARDVAAARRSRLEVTGGEAASRRALEVVTFGWLGGLLGLTLLLGMAAGLSVYVLLSLRVRSKERLRLALALAGGLWIVLRIGVEELLAVRLFGGLWRDWLGS